MIKFFLGLLYFISTVVIFFISHSSAHAFTFIERRSPQIEGWSHQPGHFIGPMPISIPGLGTGISAISSFTNIAGSPADIYLGYLIGDLSGHVLAVNDLPIYKNYLRLGLINNHFSTDSVKIYDERGMDAKKSDYNLIKYEGQSSTGARLTASFKERHIEFFRSIHQMDFTPRAIADHTGKTIVAASKIKKINRNKSTTGVVFDNTDDFNAPRKGINVEVARSDQITNDDGLRYHRWDIGLKFYTPLLFGSLAFHAFDSRAEVVNQGITDWATLIGKSNYNCNTIRNCRERKQCKKKLNTVIDNQILINKYGEATSLGGISRLRAYPVGRFSGANTQFLASEFRWNINNYAIPFDFYVLKNIKTTLQIAVFAETGTVADNRGELWKKSAYVLGSGLRIITDSGDVIRFEAGYGKDGISIIMFIGHPWGFTIG